MTISELITKLETIDIFQKTISSSSVLKSAWQYLKINPKTFATILITISLFFIFKFGYSIGEFLFYITN